VINIGRTVIELLQLVEIAAPARLYRLRILQILLVESFDKRRIGTKQQRACSRFFDNLFT
jgi:hypothetical protein